MKFTKKINLQEMKFTKKNEKIEEINVKSFLRA